jgi:general secretion pathway protein H
MTSRIEVCDSGFTLLEMVIVIVVLGLALGIVVGRGPMRSPSMEEDAAARRVAGALREARAAAVATDRPVRVAIDLDRRRVQVGARPPMALPPGLGISVTTVAGEAVGTRLAAIAFAPDGSSTGGRIELAAGERRVAIGVDWLTGRVRIADAE